MLLYAYEVIKDAVEAAVFCRADLPTREGEDAGDRRSRERGHGHMRVERRARTQCREWGCRIYRWHGGLNDDARSLTHRRQRGSLTHRRLTHPPQVHSPTAGSLTRIRPKNI